MTDDFERFTLRHLHYFLAVAETGSFRAAAARLNVAQSAVSRRVADLEAIFALQLFARHPRGVALSAAGDALRHGALRIRGEIDAANAVSKRHASGVAAMLRIGLFGTTSQLALIPPLIRRLRNEASHLALDLSSIARGEVDDTGLADLDIALFENRQILCGWLSRQLLSSFYVAAVPRGHRLARFDAIDLETLREVDLISFPRTSNQPATDALIGAAARRGWSLNIIHETASECARLALTAAGMGVSIVSPLAGFHDQRFDVEYRTLTGVVLPFDLWLATRPDVIGAGVCFADLAAQTIDRLSD